MKPDDRFQKLSKHFWANVRMLSQHLGYTVRGAGEIKVPTIAEINQAFKELELNAEHVVDSNGRPTDFGQLLVAYFQHRGMVLNTFVEPRLMDAKQAKLEFERLRRELRPKCPLPMNKQKGKKKAPAFLTGIANMLIEANAAGIDCCYDPRALTTVIRDGLPVRTLARRVDGAFPSPINPIAVWELKEYYYTTTFGSRVADGVYETLLDGMELEELRENAGIDIKHYLFLDARYTWWDCGRSYLCRVVDMLHMGYVDEVLFGREILERLPALVGEWVETARNRK
ncbi:MAG TPA: hypothetical protein PLT00_13000 [Verrucomicrobiota bacterium]|nr:hypothetical protein [Verrucomicrobiota bacterium]HQB17619.1 hypothetical protein [Verrucomicrobiota bacterium]